MVSLARYVKREGEERELGIALPRIIDFKLGESFAHDGVPSLKSLPSPEAYKRPKRFSAESLYRRDLWRAGLVVSHALS